MWPGFQTEWAQYRALLADKSTDCGHQFNLLLGYLGERRMSKAQPTVVCCGHSLGGALAVLCAQWISADYCPWARVFCVTFGAPRVGNDHFVNKYHESLPVTRHFRVQNHRDPVPKMPSQGNYVHVGQEVANCGGCPCLVHGPEEPKDVHRFQCVRDLSLVTGLHKHGMLAYVTWLNHIDTNCVGLGKGLDGGDIAFGDLLQ